jgi:hypothetical protein
VCVRVCVCVCVRVWVCVFVHLSHSRSSAACTHTQASSAQAALPARHSWCVALDAVGALPDAVGALPDTDEHVQQFNDRKVNGCFIHHGVVDAV